MFFFGVILLFFLHYLGDYPLQGDFIAKAKNSTAPIPGVPWWQAMMAHSVIQGGLVYFGVCVIYLTSSFIWLGRIGSVELQYALVLGGIAFCAEAVIHFVTDHAKCHNKISYNVDQLIHLVCKIGIAWWATPIPTYMTT